MGKILRLKGVSESLKVSVEMKFGDIPEEWKEITAPVPHIPFIPFICSGCGKLGLRELYGQDGGDLGYTKDKFYGPDDCEHYFVLDVSEPEGWTYKRSKDGYFVNLICRECSKKST